MAAWERRGGGVAMLRWRDRAVDGNDDETEVARITKEAKNSWNALTGAIMRDTVVDDGTRIDGRSTDEIRDIRCEVGVAERAHGSALFTRGETQAFVSATLGVETDAQRIDMCGNGVEALGHGPT